MAYHRLVFRAHSLRPHTPTLLTRFRFPTIPFHRWLSTSVSEAQSTIAPTISPSTSPSTSLSNLTIQSQPNRPRQRSSSSFNPTPPKTNKKTKKSSAQLRHGHRIKAPSVDGKVICYTTSESYDISTLQSVLWRVGDGRNAVNVMGEAVWIPGWRGGEVWIFESGSFVTWGMDEREATAFVEEVIRAPFVGEKRIESGEFKEIESESLDYIVRESERTGLRRDLITLGTSDSSLSNATLDILTPLLTPSLTPAIPVSEAGLPSTLPSILVRLSLSSALVRSTRLGVYEEELADFLESVKDIPDHLMAGSDAPTKKTVLTRRYGRLLKLRQRLELNEENLMDAPDYFWDYPALEGHYNALSRALDLDTRMNNFNVKLNHAFDEQAKLIEFYSSRTSHRLEWIIILIIFVECFLTVVRERESIIDILVGSQHDESLSTFLEKRENEEGREGTADVRMKALEERLRTIEALIEDQKKN